MMAYLRNGRKGLPQDVSQDMKNAIELEIKFWEIDKGITKLYNYTSVDALKVDEMLQTIPEITKGVSRKGLSVWKELGPLKLDEILENSKKLDQCKQFKFDDKEMEF